MANLNKRDFRVPIDRLPAELIIQPHAEYVRRSNTGRLGVLMIIQAVVVAGMWWGYLSGGIKGAEFWGMICITVIVIAIAISAYWMAVRHVRLVEMVAIQGRKLILGGMLSTQVIDLSSPGELVIAEGPNRTWRVYSSAHPRGGGTVSKDAYPTLPRDLVSGQVDA